MNHSWNLHWIFIVDCERKIISVWIACLEFCHFAFQGKIAAVRRGQPTLAVCVNTDEDTNIITFVHYCIIFSKEKKRSFYFVILLDSFVCLWKTSSPPWCRSFLTCAEKQTNGTSKKDWCIKFRSVLSFIKSLSDFCHKFQQASFSLRPLSVCWL